MQYQNVNIYLQEIMVQESISIKSIDNVIQKLNIFMTRNNQTMHALASNMGFAYQPFYRFMTKKSLPTISSLDTIAQNLNCTVSELIADNVFLDINAYESIDNFLDNILPKNIRIYLPENIIKEYLFNKFFSIKVNCNNFSTLFSFNGIEYNVNTNIFQLFIVTNKIDIDGYFLVDYQNHIQILHIVNVSRIVVTANYNGELVSIPVAEIKVFAQFINYVELPNHSHLIINAIEL